MENLTAVRIAIIRFLCQRHEFLHIHMSVRKPRATNKSWEGKGSGKEFWMASYANILEKDVSVV